MMQAVSAAAQAIQIHGREPGFPPSLLFVARLLNAFAKRDDAPSSRAGS
ncbi:hypothetical protein [Streptomyces sp. NPDC054826]